jgi:hypothetical protein
MPPLEGAAEVGEVGVAKGPADLLEAQTPRPQMCFAQPLPQLVERHNITRIIIAMPSASRAQLRHVLEMTQATRLDTKII